MHGSISNAASSRIGMGYPLLEAPSVP